MGGVDTDGNPWTGWNPELESARRWAVALEAQNAKAAERLLYAIQSNPNAHFHAAGEGCGFCEAYAILTGSLEVVQ